MNNLIIRISCKPNRSKAFLILVLFVFVYSFGLSQTTDIHSFNSKEEKGKLIRHVDSLMHIDYLQAFNYTSKYLDTNLIFEKPDLYSDLIVRAINSSFMMGNLDYSDSLFQILVDFPRQNSHPFIKSKILLNKAKSARIQRRQLEALKYSKEALLNYQQIQDEYGQLRAISLIIRVYFDLGNYDNALNYLPEIERLSIREQDKEFLTSINSFISRLYVYKGELFESQSYLNKAKEYAAESQHSLAFVNFNQGIIYYKEENYNKSIKYFDSSIKGKYELNLLISIASTITYKAAVAMRQEKYRLAEYYNREALRIREKAHSRFHSASSYYNIANTLIYQEKYDSALHYIAIADELYSIYEIKPSLKRGNELKKSIYLKKRDFENAYHTLEDIIDIEDSLYAERSKIKLEEIESNIQVSKYEKEKADLQAKNITQQSKIENNQILLKTSIVILVFAIVFSYFLFLHIREKNKRKLLRINQQLIFVQMNSHFVFNALTAIQSLLFKKQIESAIHYLAIFSNLVKKVLFVTHKRYVGIQIEITFIMEYLQLQKLRFGDDLKYQLLVSDDVYMDENKLPPLLLYPYIEFAVEECVQRADKNGVMIIKADVDKKYFYYRLIDVDLGFSDLETCYIKRFAKDKISCLDLTNQRLSLYNHFYRTKIEFFIENYFYKEKAYPAITFKIRK